MLSQDERTQYPPYVLYVLESHKSRSSDLKGSFHAAFHSSDDSEKFPSRQICMLHRIKYFFEKVPL